MKSKKVYQKERYHALKAMGRCPVCGKESEGVLCNKCLEKRRENYAYKEAHMTAEQRDARNARSLEKVNKRNRERRAAGLCAVCGKVKSENFCCDACREKRRLQRCRRMERKRNGE